MSFVICDAELEALQGQAHMNYCIYLYIRRFMDYATGVVGLKRGISYQSISEAIYIEPRAGVKGGSPHKSSIRRAIEQLLKSGLIERMGCPDNLVFKMPFAYADNNVRKKADSKPTPHPDTPKLPQNKAFKGEADTPKIAKADIPPFSDKTINRPPPPIVIHSMDFEAPQAVAVEFSKIIKTENQPAILAAMKNVKQDFWQMLIDDLIGYCSKQATSKNPVKNPAGVMRKMVQRVQLGEYVADLAHVGQQLRGNERRANLRVIATEKPPAKPPTEKQLSDFRNTFRKVKA